MLTTYCKIINCLHFVSSFTEIIIELLFIFSLKSEARYLVLWLTHADRCIQGQWYCISIRVLIKACIKPVFMCMWTCCRGIHLHVWMFESYVVSSQGQIQARMTWCNVTANWDSTDGHTNSRCPQEEYSEYLYQR